jgi:mannose-1-phosphate guanylyltransferase / phosphomannomutase
MSGNNMHAQTALQSTTDEPPLRRAAAAFLDRDGTINRHVGYLAHPDQLELLPGAADAIRALNEAGVLAIVVTNQPVVARGDCDEATLGNIHAHLEQLLAAHGAWLDAIYYCPHDPQPNSDVVSRERLIACVCRKPETGLVERAVAEWNVDLGRSAFFGDSWRDVELARRVMIPCYYLGDDPSHRRAEGRPANNLWAAVQDWLRGRAANTETLLSS